MTESTLKYKPLGTFKFADAEQAEKIRTVILRLLDGLGIEYSDGGASTTVPEEFFSSCQKQALSYGMTLAASARPEAAHRLGAMAAYTAYGHLDDKSQIFMALYTTAFFHCDDNVSAEDAAPFAAHMMRGMHQGTANLDAIVRFLRDSSAYVEPFVAQIAIASWLNFMIAIVFEDERCQIARAPESYATHKRYLNGLGDIYAIMVFPRTIPLGEYVRVIPDLSKLAATLNDVLSFYKEQVGAEDINLVSDLAAIRGTTNICVFEQLADECIELHRRVRAALGDDTPARKAYNSFLTGFVQFHTTVSRYRLKELGIHPGA